MKTFIRVLSFLLVIVMLVPSIVACSDNGTTGQPNESGNNNDGKLPTFNNETFGILAILWGSSTFSSSYYMIADDGPDPDVVSNDIYLRNLKAEEDLKIKLMVTPMEIVEGIENVETHVATQIRKLNQSGDTTYSLFVNHLYYLGNLSIEGLFYNIKDLEYLNLEEDYWYGEYMDDVALLPDQKYILAGDYFMDIIRSAHCMVFNKTLFEDSFPDEDPETLYHHVQNNTWTLDKLNEYIAGAYHDLDGNGKRNNADQFGLVSDGSWPSVIPFILSSDVKFIERDSQGIPSLAADNEHAVDVVEKITGIFQQTATNYKLTDNRANEAFTEGRSLFLGDSRLASLEYLRAMEDEIGVVPYPRFDDSQINYHTTTHDSTEVGAIPVNITDLEFVGTVVEFLCKQTSEIVLHDYYENGLKLKYARDKVTAEMIDIIHDNLRDSFILAYEHALGSTLLYDTFNVAIRDKKNYISLYKTSQGSTEKALKEHIQALQKIAEREKAEKEN